MASVEEWHREPDTVNRETVKEMFVPSLPESVACSVMRRLRGKQRPRFTAWKVSDALVEEPEPAEWRDKLVAQQAIRRLTKVLKCNEAAAANRLHVVPPLSGQHVIAS